MIVVDASVAAKWFLTEPQTEEADAFLARYDKELCGPDLLRVEVCRALVAAANARRITTAQAHAALDRWLQRTEPGGLLLYATDGVAMKAAADLAMRLGHPLKDCIYLVLADRLGCPLVTADARFRDRAPISPVSGCSPSSSEPIDPHGRLTAPRKESASRRMAFFPRKQGGSAMRITVAAVAAFITCAAVAPAAAQDAASAPPPAAPAGLAPSFVAPAHDGDGFVTPNRYLSAAETAWHVRAALNVAALGCRGAGEDARAAGYNALLAQHRVPLAAASAGTQAAYRARYGAAWEARLDGDMTRLYNYWAEPGAHAAFCAAADAVLADASVTEPAAFGPFAAAALVRLEAPFLAFFTAAERYRIDQAQWRAAHEPVQVAAVQPLP